MDSNYLPLSGARIWLSGSIPPDDEALPSQREAIADFVGNFARAVFESGGHIIHGSHPTFVPILLGEAERFQRDSGGKKDLLTLVVSRYWSRDAEIDGWRESALVYETPEVTGGNSEKKSLELLRQWVASRSDAIVTIGGKWWKSRSGVPMELEIASERGLPCFLLGGFGGSIKGYQDSNPRIFSSLKNGLTAEENRRLAQRKDVGEAANLVCNQLARLPLVRGKGSDGSSFRILSLDGGGLKGVFSAAALAAWEEQTKLNVVDHFDLIAGTSTGGILAIGLGLGLSAKEMLCFYKEKGKIIFPVTSLPKRIKYTIKNLRGPKYAQETLLNEIDSAYNPNNEKYKLKDSRCRLLIPSYHAVAGESHVFRTPHHPNLTGDSDLSAAHVALATAAAPTYFSAAKIADMISESSYFDGGVWANSPALAAVIESVCFLGIPVEKIDLLSIGTTEEPFTAREKLNAGIINWAKKQKILKLLMNAQQESSIKLTQNLVGYPKFLRVNQMTMPDTYSLDSPKEINELAGLGGRKAMEINIFSQIKSRFLNGVHAVPWHKY